MTVYIIYKEGNLYYMTRSPSKTLSYSKDLGESLSSITRCVLDRDDPVEVCYWSLEAFIEGEDP